MSNWLRRAVTLAAIGAVSALSGCATIHHANAHFNKDSQTIHHLDKKKVDQKQPSIGHPAFQMFKTPYLTGVAYQMHHAVPSVLKQRVTFKSQSQLPVQSILQHVSDMTGVDIAIQPSALSWLSGASQSGGATQSGGQNVKLPNPPGTKGKTISVHLPSQILPSLSNAGNIELNYRGSLAGLLNSVTAKTGLDWAWKSGRVWVYLTQTRTYTLAAMPGTQGISASFSNEGKLKASSGSGDQSATSLSGGASTGASFSVKKLDIFKGVTKSVKALLSQYKSDNIPIAVTSNSEAGVIAVTAPPAGQEAVAAYISQINREMTREVYIGVHIYQVVLSHDQNYNFNLKAAFQNALSQYGFNLTSPSSLSVPTGSGQASLFVLQNATGSYQKWSGSKVVGSALADMGKVDNSTSSSVLAMSGQVTPFQHATQQGYLASSSTTTSSNVGATTSLQPGQITTGLIGSFLPRVLSHHRILLRYTLVLSALKSLNTITSGGSSIQIPTIASNAQSPTVLLHSGATLVMAGLTDYAGTTNASGTGSAHFWGLGGGTTASTSRTALVIVLHVVQLGESNNG